MNADQGVREVQFGVDTHMGTEGRPQVVGGERSVLGVFARAVRHADDLPHPEAAAGSVAVVR